MLKKSIELIEKFSGKKPRGYVAPWWEMSAVTAELLLRERISGTITAKPITTSCRSMHGRRCLDEDRLSKQAADWMHPLQRGKEVDLVEIGANWYVDDLPPMMFIKKSPNSHGFVNPRHLEEMWRDEFDWVYREMDYAVFPITIHPDVSGRPQVLLMLERLIGHINAHDGVRWVTMEEMAEDFRARQPFPAVIGRAACAALRARCSARSNGRNAARSRYQASHGSGETGRRQQRHAPYPPAAQGAGAVRAGGRRRWSATSYMWTIKGDSNGLAAAIGELWRVAEQMAGKPLDPLNESCWSGCAMQRRNA